MKGFSKTHFSYTAYLVYAKHSFTCVIVFSSQQPCEVGVMISN